MIKSFVAILLGSLGFRRRAGGHVLGPGAGAVRRSEEIHVIKLEPEQLRDEGVSLLPSCRRGE